MGGALSKALVELVEQRRIGRWALGLSLPGGAWRDCLCLHQRETRTGRAQGARRPLPAVACRAGRGNPGPSSAEADGPGPEPGSELLRDHSHMLPAGSSVGRSGRQASRAGPAGPLHLRLRMQRRGAARRRIRP